MSAADSFPIEVETERGRKAVWVVDSPSYPGTLSVNEVDRHTGWHRTSCGHVVQVLGSRYVALPWSYKVQDVTALTETFVSAEQAARALVLLRFRAETLSEVRDA